MVEKMTGLFGPSPYEVQQARNQQMNTSAENFAQMNATQRGVMGMYKGGAGLAGMGAGMMGMVDPAVANAQRTEQIMGQGGSDLSSSAGLLAKAEEFRKAGDLRTATALALKGNEMKKQEDAAALATRKQDFQENETMSLKREQLAQQAELKKAQLEQALEAAKLRSADARYTADQRREAAREATSMRGQIAQLMVEMKRQGIEAKSAAKAVEKPMTEAQRTKFDLDRSGAINKAKSIDSQLAELTAQANLVTNHTSAGTATGTGAEFFPSVLPGSIDYKAQLDNLKGRLTKIAKDAISESGKIGSMQVQEWKILLDTISSITPSANKQAVNDAIANVVAETGRLRDLHYDQLNEKYGSESAIEKPPIVVPTKRSQYISGSVQQPPTTPAQTAATTPIYANNGQVRIMSTDGGKTWKPAGAK